MILLAAPPRFFFFLTKKIDNNKFIDESSRHRAIITTTQNLVISFKSILMYNLQRFAILASLLLCTSLAYVSRQAPRTNVPITAASKKIPAKIVPAVSPKSSSPFSQLLKGPKPASPTIVKASTKASVKQLPASSTNLKPLVKVPPKKPLFRFTLPTLPVTKAPSMKPTVKVPTKPVAKAVSKSSVSPNPFSKLQKPPTLLAFKAKKSTGPAVKVGPTIRRVFPTENFIRRQSTPGGRLFTWLLLASFLYLFYTY
jgi:hypothetical protein